MMESIKKSDVFFRFSDSEIPVGQMILDGAHVLFKYHSKYLDTGFNISPKKLKFDDSIQTTDRLPFRGLFGVFADSLPDAWGNLLLRRWLSARNISMEQLSVLDRLTFIGQNSEGALVYRPSKEDRTSSSPIDLDSLDQHLGEVLQGESDEIIDDLFQRGGSPGGARPKVFAGYNRSENKLIYGVSELPANFEHWLIKFGATIDSADSANSEMAYYRMAIEAGLQMSESTLLVGQSGKKYFATKRFDRNGNDRLHFISAAGMFHDDYEHSQLDYGTLIYETSELINDQRITEQQFRRAVFNVFAHNRDDHSKNFGFLANEKGIWSLAPAYDLTFSSSSQGMHSTTCARNGVNPGTKELMELAKHFSIQKGEEIITEVKAVIREWEFFAENESVSTNTRKTIARRLKEIDH